MPQDDFWSWIRKSRLVHVLLGYLGVSWAIIEVTALVREEFQLPFWVTPVAMLLLAVGLVVILATAWVQGRMGSGIPREELPRPWEVDLIDLKESVSHGRFPHLTWARAIVGGLVAFSLLFGAAGAYVLVTHPGSPIGTSQAYAAAGPGIAVLPFQVVGPDPEIWEEGMMTVLATNLETAAGLRKIDPRAVVSHWRKAVGGRGELGVDGAITIARDLGASYAVMGRMVGPGPEVRLTAEVYDVTEGERRGTARVQGSPDSLLALIDRLSVEVLRSGLLPAAAELPEIDLGSVTTTSFPALRSYLEGERYYRRSRPEPAIEAFQRALDLDSTFALAAYRLAQSHAETGSPRLAEEYSARAAALGERLPDRERRLLAANALLQKGRLRALEALRDFTARYPDDVEGWNLLGQAYVLLGPQAGYGPEHYRTAYRRAVELSPYYGPAYAPWLLKDAFVREDSAEVRELLAGYREIDAQNAYCAGFELAYGLVWGDGATRAEAFATLDTLGPDPLQCTAGATVAWPELSDTLVTRFRELSGPREPPSVRESALWGLAIVNQWQGKVREGRSALLSIPEGSPYRPHALRVYLVSQLAHYPEADGIEEVAGALGSADDAWRPFYLGALAARHGETDRVAAMLTALEAGAREADARNDSVDAADRRAFARALRGYQALLLGQQERAARDLEAAIPRIPALGPGFIRSGLLEFLRYELTRSKLALGAPKEARALAENFEYWSSPYSIFSELQLARAHEALGDLDRARLHYGRFVRWWDDCDPELEPLREQARRALSRLAAET